MWILAVYDCPTTTSEARREYHRFHKRLLRENFIQHQLSVYARHFPTMAAAETVILRLKRHIPPDAHVAFFILTDRQYGMTREFFGPRPARNKPDKPAQIELF